jgi:hypothetical protein
MDKLDVIIRELISINNKLWYKNDFISEDNLQEIKKESVREAATLRLQWRRKEIFINANVSLNISNVKCYTLSYLNKEKWFNFKSIKKWVNTIQVWDRYVLKEDIINNLEFNIN